MNERIRVLAEQADFSEYPDLDDTYIVHQNELEKFSELIVRDTIDLLRKEWYDLNNIETQPEESARDIGYRNGRKIEIIDLIEKIKKRYRVKE
jgi:hypothetical protein